jgi:sigma-B regulation protein RsbU (phosphoserine phosphatase)
MSTSSSKILPASGRSRRLLASQALYLVVAIALFAVVWITNWRHTDFLAILLYSLFTGNLTTIAMRYLARFFSPLPLPYRWLVYVAFLFLSALASSALCLVLIMAVFRIPFSNYSSEFWVSGRLGVVVITIVGIIYHAYVESRTKLEHRNLELQRAVESEQTHSQLQDQEIGKAREIQEGLLPKTIPQLRGLEVSGAWQPARIVGGDYFDVLKFGDRRIGICIGDVVGKGIGAALLMANLQASFRAFALESVPPATLCQKLNEVFSNNLAGDKFVTFCYCTIDAADHRLTYASAGHCPPIILRKNGASISLNEGGTPLGIDPERTYIDAEAQLETGDRLILYTDGLTEAMDHADQEFGQSRLVELASRNVALSAAELLTTIMSDVSSFSGGSFQDDFTLVVVAVK